MRRNFAGASYRVLTAALLSASACLATTVVFAEEAPPPQSDQPIVLGPVKVEDKNNANNNRHETGLPLLPGTLQDTPQAANVISQETLQQQGVASLEQALRNVPGITIAIGEGGTLAGDQFKIRGFDAKDDVYLDGLRDFGAYTRDSFNYEEVQVLKGPSGLMFGRGTTGGAINTISKTPFLGTSTELEAYIGNGSYYRGLADVNYQLGDTTAFRVNIMGTTSHVVDRDMVNSKRWGFAPSISFGLGTDTTFTLSYFHQQDNRIPDYGIVIAQKPGELIALPASENGVKRSNFLGYETDRDDSKVDLFTARLNHKASDWLTLSNDTRVGIYNRYFQYTTIDRCDNTSATAFCAAKLFGANPETAEGGIGGGGPYDQNAWGIQDIFSARADFELGGLRNQLVAGVDISYQKNDKAFFAYSLPSTAVFTYSLGNHTASRANIGRNLFAPEHAPPPGYAPFRPTLANVGTSSFTATTVLDSTGDATDYGVFVTDRLYFSDQWSVLAGVRLDRYKANYDSVTVAGAHSSIEVSSDLTSPRTALVYEPNEDQTYYVSYARAETPQATSIVGAATAVALTARDLKPEVSTTWEAGAKLNFFDGDLGVTGSVFQVEKGNALQVDPNTQTLEAQSGEKQRVRGFELSVTGQITDMWTANAAYTFLDSVTLESFSCGTAPQECKPNPFIIGRSVIFVPKNSASLWTTYDLAEAVMPGLLVGAGVTYTSKYNVRYVTSGTAPNPTGLAQIAQIPESISFDALVAYEMEDWRLALNAYNLTDRLNYSQAFGNRGTPAPGRTFLFSVGYKL